MLEVSQSVRRPRPHHADRSKGGNLAPPKRIAVDLAAGASRQFVYDLPAGSPTLSADARRRRPGDRQQGRAPARVGPAGAGPRRSGRRRPAAGGRSGSWRPRASRWKSRSGPSWSSAITGDAGRIPIQLGRGRRKSALTGVRRLAAGDSRRRRARRPMPGRSWSIARIRWPRGSRWKGRSGPARRRPRSPARAIITAGNVTLVDRPRGRLGPASPANELRRRDVEPSGRSRLADPVRQPAAVAARGGGRARRRPTSGWARPSPSRWPTTPGRWKSSRPPARRGPSTRTTAAWTCRPSRSGCSRSSRPAASSSSPATPSAATNRTWAMPQPAAGATGPTRRSTATGR